MTFLSTASFRVGKINGSRLDIKTATTASPLYSPPSAENGECSGGAEAANDVSNGNVVTESVGNGNHNSLGAPAPTLPPPPDHYNFFSGMGNRGQTIGPPTTSDDFSFMARNLNASTFSGADSSASGAVDNGELLSGSVIINSGSSHTFVSEAGILKIMF